MSCNVSNLTTGLHWEQLKVQGAKVKFFLNKMHIRITW
jgi:hypothetical protein